VWSSGQRRLASGICRNQDNGVLSRLRKSRPREDAVFLFLYRIGKESTMQDQDTLRLTRRNLTKAAAGGLAARPARAAGAPETTKAKLGFIALTDAAPLFVADEKGFFKKHGMTEVEVLKQSSWGTTRDNLVLGSPKGGIDGAHILTPMPYLIASGANDRQQRAGADVHPGAAEPGRSVHLGGQGIRRPEGRHRHQPFKRALAAKKAKGTPVKAAMTFPGGTHDMWIRYWLAAGGIDPNKDISTIVVPPAQMVANMKVGSMDTFCVCEPWNRQLINQGIGYTAVTTGELWHNHPEKAFACAPTGCEANPNATQALLRR
jgi:nitrate/nitrite transport system substrate-binding protein